MEKKMADKEKPSRPTPQPDHKPSERPTPTRKDESGPKTYDRPPGEQTSSGGPKRK